VIVINAELKILSDSVHIILTFPAKNIEKDIYLALFITCKLFPHLYASYFE
jgi:hypothetical protein